MRRKSFKKNVQSMRIKFFLFQKRQAGGVQPEPPLPGHEEAHHQQVQGQQERHLAHTNLQVSSPPK